MRDYLREKWYSRIGGSIVGMFGFYIGYISPHWLPIIGFVIAPLFAYAIDNLLTPSN